MKHLFKIGDRVRVVKYGFGCTPDELGLETYIQKLGTYSDLPGYITDPPLGNGKTTVGMTFYAGYNGEPTFELVFSKSALNDLKEIEIPKI